MRRPTALSQALGPAALVLSVILLLVALGSTARAQPPGEKTPPESKKTESPPAKEGDEKTDDDSKKKDADKAKPGDLEEETKPTTSEDREALPHGVFVPPPKPAEFAINDPKTTDEQWKNWSKGKAKSDFNSRVQAGDHDAQSDKIVQDGIREQLAAMTLPAMRDPKAETFQISVIVQSLLRSVKTAANKKPTGDQRQYRIFMMQQIIKDCRELQLASNQYYVRLNAAVLLANLFLEEANPSSKTEPEFYTPAFDALMEVLEKEGQSEAVKITAITGLQNACLFGNPPLQVNDNVRLAKRLISELEKPGTHEWYQERLCDALSAVDQVHDLTGQPFIVQALSKVLFDTSRPFCARAAAARALGRTPLDPSIDLNVIAYGIADLSRQMVEARNEGKKHVRRWCVAYIFLAFQPRNTSEKARHAGLLDRVEDPTFSKYRKTVTQVWAAIRPMIVEELKHRFEPDIEFPADVLAPISQWLKENTPTDLRISPTMPPVTTTQVTKVDANGHK
ncbi:MAG TPA: hypothetical protein VGP63_04725 [Planctomycetaceae bacterium]|nr:hypothetical protein [Planctomycetaceae bacterium]